MNNLIFKKSAWYLGLFYLLFFVLLFVVTFFIYPIFYGPIPPTIPPLPSPSVNYITQERVPLPGQALSVLWGLARVMSKIVPIALLLSFLFKPRFASTIVLTILILFTTLTLPIFIHSASCTILRWEFCF